MPYSNSQHLASATSKQGLNRKVQAALLRVRTGPECLEGNLRELMWDSQRERKKERDRETERELSHKKPGSQSRKGAIISAPEMASSSTKLQAGSQLLTKTSWDSGWLTSTRRVAARDQLPRRDTQYTWDGVPAVYPGNWVAGTGEAIRDTHYLGRVCSPSTWSLSCSDLGRAQTQAQLNLCLCGVPENLNLSGLDLGNPHNPGPTLESSPAEKPGAWAV